MTRSTEWLSQRIVILAAGLYYLAVVLRAWLFYQDGPHIGRVLGLLLLWLLLLFSEPALSRRWSGYFLVYLTIQTALVFVLVSMPGTTDFMATLLGILSMQVMLRLPTRVGAIWIGLCGVILGFLLIGDYQSQAIALVLLYTAANIFLGSYTRTIRLAQDARQQNQALSKELEQTNQQLQDYSSQLEQLAAARERNRLARELHDSVTQTVFSMSLTAQSAALYFERDRKQVGSQLERLYTLARSALDEMQLLIEELKPVPIQQAGLSDALQRMLGDGRFSGELTVINKSMYEKTIYIPEVNLTILSIDETSISIIVTADEEIPGNTIIVNLQKNFLTNRLLVEFNEIPLRNSETLEDVIDSDNDGPFAEYFLVETSDASQLLLSIPHFSTHIITIHTIGEDLRWIISGTPAILLYLVLCIIGIIAFLIPYYTWPARVRKGKKL